MLFPFHFSGKSLIPQEALNVPSDWQQQTGSAELISVRPGSAEWDHVQGSLKRSLRAAKVVDIQRVQNKWLYRKYAIQRHLLKDKNGQSSFSLCSLKGFSRDLIIWGRQCAVKFDVILGKSGENSWSCTKLKMSCLIQENCILNMLQVNCIVIEKIIPEVTSRYSSRTRFLWINNVQIKEFPSY